MKALPQSSLPVKVYAWFGTGDGTDGPLEARLEQELEDGHALVLILDAEHVETYGDVGEEYRIYARRLGRDGHVCRDEYAWSPEP
jgi:hypothetical protein